MDTLTILIMLVLFVIAMIFVFSTALLTPYIGRRNFLAVVGLGLVVGVVGGAFLLSPIVDDLPDFSRTIIEDTVEGTDNIEMNLSTNGNLTQLIQNISSIEGVNTVNYDFIEYRMNDDFDGSYYRTRFLSTLNSSNENISSIEDMGDNVYHVHIAENGDPQGVLNSIYNTFKYENYVSLRYTAMPAQAEVVANNVTNVMNQIRDNGAIITGVTGPTEDRIQVVESHIPNSTDVVILSGILGIIVAIAGFFIDSLYSFADRRRRNRAKEESSRDKIKRKTIPNPERNRRSFNQQNVRRSDSIDIFDESFDSSSKQNIGSNRNFRQLGEEEQPPNRNRSRNVNDATDKPVQESVEGSRGSFFSRLFNRSGNDNKEEKSKSQTTDDHDEQERGTSRQRSRETRNSNNDQRTGSSHSGDRPRIRPRRRQ